MSAMPPDRSAQATEHRHPRSGRLHEMTPAQCVALLHEADREAVEAVGRIGPAIARFVEAILPGFEAGGRLVYVGAGTSGRLGVLDASEAQPTFCVEPGRIVGIIAGGDAALRRSSEGKEDDPLGAAADLDALHLGPHDAVLGIAAGGTTPYVLGAIRLARERGAGVTGLLACAEPGAEGGAGEHAERGASWREACDHLIVCQTGPEVLTGSTRLKAGTATKLVLNAISTTLMVRTGRVYENLMVDVRATNDKLKDRAARIVGMLTGLDRSAAFALLQRAAWAVKPAVVMHRLGVPREDAERRLSAARGRLGDVLDAKRTTTDDARG